MTCSHNLSLQFSCPLNGRAVGPSLGFWHLPLPQLSFPPSLLSSDQGAGGQHVWLLSRGWDSKGSHRPSEFLLTLEAEQAGVDEMPSSHLAWLLSYLQIPCHWVLQPLP